MDARHSATTYNDHLIKQYLHIKHDSGCSFMNKPEPAHCWTQSSLWQRPLGRQAVGMARPALLGPDSPDTSYLPVSVPLSRYIGMHM
jgi:hypothetical protein